jgi:Flp pilus assembly CpaF family ATPase
MQCRQPSLEGNGEITLRRLIKEALRMRPDRLVGYLYKADPSAQYSDAKHV